MELERRILERLLPRRLYERIDIENTSIRRFLERESQRLPPGALVLDAGAGRCQYRALFRRQRYVSVDFARGEETWDYRHLDVIGRLEALPFADSSFDVVVCTQVLEHVAEPRAVLVELGRILRPGGRLLLTAPLSFGEHQQPFDFYRYTSFGLRHLLETSGFEVVSLEARGGFYWFISVMLIYLYDRLFPSGQRLVWKLLLLPLRLPAAFLFLVLLPQIFYYLDRTDTRRDITLGYASTARRIEGTR